MIRRGASLALRQVGLAQMAMLALTMAAAISLVLIAAAQPASGQPRAASGTNDLPVVTVPAPVPSDAHETFRSRVRDEMADWRRKMQAFDDDTEAHGKRVTKAAETRLRSAWDDTEVEARNLEVATARDWDRTKRSFEAASHRMAAAWDKVRL